MSASTNMLEPPTAKTLTFAPTSEQWTFKDGDRKPTAEETHDLSTILTKDVDGPNEYTTFVGRVVAAYLMNQFRDTEGLRSVFGEEHVNTLGPYLVQDVQHIVDQLRATGKVSLYYNAYKLHSGYLNRITLLVNVLHILNLENTLNGIVEKAQGVSESVLAGADTSESEESDEECVLDDLEMRFANLLNP
jgi:hypothetical protein